MLRLRFWNSGVAPTRGAGKRTSQQAGDVVRRCLDGETALVALCEVDRDAMREMAERVADPGVAWLCLDAPVGRSRWDLGAFFRTDLVRVEAGEPVTERAYGNHIRVAHSLRVGGERAFRLYLLHWRSRLRADGAEHRDRAAYALARSIRHDLEFDVPVVVMGDFNDEPHDDSLGRLEACRDPRHVMRLPGERLFNPCWWLAAPPGDDPWRPFGSYPHPGGRTSGSYLLDQALTSAHFLDREARRAPAASIGLDPGFRATDEYATLDHAPLTLELPWPPRQALIPPSNTRSS